MLVDRFEGDAVANDPLDPARVEDSAAAQLAPPPAPEHASHHVKELARGDANDVLELEVRPLLGQQAAALARPVGVRREEARVDASR